MGINYTKTRCDGCEHTVALGVEHPPKPLVRSQDGSVLCVDCIGAFANAKLNGRRTKEAEHERATTASSRR